MVYSKVYDNINMDGEDKTDEKTVISSSLVPLMLSMAASGNTGAASDLAGELSLNMDEALMELEDSLAEKPTKNRDAVMSVQYMIGDIIRADGSIVKGTDLTSIDNNNVPIAVIGGFKEDGMAFGVGVHRSNTPLQWASDHSAGYATSFINIVCTQDSEFDFSGDKNGTDNWNEICTQDQEDTTDAEVNYPAFHFVNTYAESYGLSGDFAVGWYMPSIEELCDIYHSLYQNLRLLRETDGKASL